MELTTQDFLEFKKIQDGIIILKNNGLRGVLMVSSLNFALKSADEQSAIIGQFQNFLNSLDFSCQIVIQSRKLNITGYLERLAEIEEKEQNELLKLQISEYKKFIEQIAKEGSIMQKTFYVVVPFSLSEARPEAMNMKTIPKISLEMTDEQFDRCKSQLFQRMEFTILGLRACGLESVPLTTPELIELFWSLYHPVEAESGYYPEMPPELTEL